MKTQTPIACFLITISLAAVTPPSVADTVLITGSNSGIGFELARQYAAEDWTVIATHRRDSMPESLAHLSAVYDNVRVEKIDVTDVATMIAVADKLDGMPIDILINNAGIVGALVDPAQQFGQLDFDQYERYMDINMAGPLRMSEVFYDNVAVAVYMPGLVLVERTRKYGFPEETYTPVETSAANLRERFAELSLESSGSFLNHTGEQLPW